MATSNRGQNRGRSGRNNNNPEGRNQYSGGVISSARDNPLATAAAVGGAVAAGVFLWSRRNQISDQIGTLSEQINEWREGSAGTGESSSGRSQSEYAEEAMSLKQTGQTV